MIVFVNSWGKSEKSRSKYAVKVRLGKLTVFDLYIDVKKKLWGVMAMNVGMRKK